MMLFAIAKTIEHKSSLSMKHLLYKKISKCRKTISRKPRRIAG